MKKQKINKKYSFKISWIPKDSDWVLEAQAWDGQWFYEFFMGDEKVGEAAFVYSENTSFIMPCDFVDLAIEIAPNHQGQGLGSFAIKHVIRKCKKPLFYNKKQEHTKAGLSLLNKLNITAV